jgi:hypothetical protein
VSQSYEHFHNLVRDLPSAATEAERDVRWLDDASILGIARDPSGRLEIFLTGEPLKCSSSIVAANLGHNEWHRPDAGLLSASRLLLPSEEHFDAIAAFLCAHLIENDVTSNVQKGFTRSESVVEMALERSRLQGESLVGLIGELLVLRSLLIRWPAQTDAALASWFGFTRSSRDFQVGTIGVEVKTTMGSNSRHHIQGLRQVELGHSTSRGFESTLYLASIGLEPLEAASPHAGSWTLPQLVDSLVELIRRHESDEQHSAALEERLLSQIRDYGLTSGLGYDHTDLQHTLTFAQQWQLSFARAYRMDDPAISVPRSGDCAAFAMIDPETITFVIELPNQITGDSNPMVGLPALADAVGIGQWDDGI